ncbi:hypothetical protein TYRP_023125, partial [Tyrophagus putrescentiae]
FRHCFYQSSKEVLDIGKSIEIGPRQWLAIAVFLYALKMPFVVYIMYTDYSTSFNFRRHEMLLGFCSAYRLVIDHWTLLMVHLFIYIFFALEYWTWRLDSCHRTWRFWWQLTVQSLEDYQQCTLERSKLSKVLLLREEKYRQVLAERVSQFPVSLQITLARVLAKVATAYTLEHIDRRRFLTTRPLTLMPRLRWHLRRRTLQVMLITEYLAFGTQIVSVLGYWSAIPVFLYFYPDWTEPSLLAIFQLSFDVTSAYYIFLCLIRWTFLFAAQTFIGKVVFTGHVSDERRLLKANLRICQQRNRNILPLFLERSVFCFLREHNLVCFHVLSGSLQLWGRLIFGILLTQVPINIVFVKRLFFDQTPALLRLVFAIFFVAQVLIYGIIFLPLSYCTKVYHSPKKIIPQLIQHLTGQNAVAGGRRWTLGNALKLDDLYGRLMNGPRFAVFIGSLQPITYLSSLESFTII